MRTKSVKEQEQLAQGKRWPARWQNGMVAPLVQHISPLVSPKGITFSLHDHAASKVRVLGSWNDWQAPGLIAVPLIPDTGEHRK